MMPVWRDVGDTSFPEAGGEWKSDEMGLPAWGRGPRKSLGGGEEGGPGGWWLTMVLMTTTANHPKKLELMMILMIKMIMMGGTGSREKQR